MAPSPHSTCTFDARLYASFGPQLKQVKIRGSLEKLSSRRGWWVMIGGGGCCRCKFRSVLFGRWGVERFESQDLDIVPLFWEGRFWSQVPQGMPEQDEASSFSSSLGWQVVLILLEPLGWTAQETWNGLDMTWGKKGDSGLHTVSIVYGIRVSQKEVDNDLWKIISKIMCPQLSIQSPFSYIVEFPKNGERNGSPFIRGW